ncbi:CAP domain-containing protein [Streptomyces sp. NPDC046985]|uniref:CAP domain-containing protein n=1 Tax=Streptomyces sp. NPDC046985 TaxID=3155377 RepID=UPI00340A829D
MGRHRRPDAGRAATDRTTGAADRPGSYAPGPNGGVALADDRMGIAPYLNQGRYEDAYATAREDSYGTVRQAPFGDSMQFRDSIPFGDSMDYGDSMQFGDFPDLGVLGDLGNFGDLGDFRDVPGFVGEDFSAADDAHARTADTALLTPGGFPSGDYRSGDFPSGSFPSRDFTSGSFPSGDFPTGSFPSDGFRPSGDARRGTGHRRRKKAAAPVRTGLLGVSAAVALGTVAVATGAVPGLQNYRLGGDDSTADQVQAAGTPTNSASEQGGASGDALPGARPGGSGADRGAGRSAVPTQSASSAPSAPSAAPSASASSAPAAPSAKPTTAPGRTAGSQAPQAAPSPDAPARTAAPTAPSTRPPAAASAEAAAEAEVLRLVNQERAQAGCHPLTANGPLTSLAEGFSTAMAEQGFFDHTDPSGATPWDRAAKRGITGLGGENIARGQADAAAVMTAWMNSPGHRANILNCDFKTLGVGVHFGAGGPWWTQDFGY